MSLTVSRRLHCGFFGALTVSMLVSPLTSAQPRSLLVHERDVPSPLAFYPRLSYKWSNHNLLDLIDNLTSSPLVIVASGEYAVERVAFDVEGASLVNVRDYAAGADGSIVLCGTARGPGPRLASFVSWISPDRKRRVIARVWPFVPERVALAADDSIWAVGNMHQDPGDSTAERDVIQRFDLSGRLLASISPHPWILPGETPNHNFLSYLLTSRDRVGWFTYGNQYLEYSLEGRELGRYEGPTGVTVTLEKTDIRGVGLSPGGEVAACVRQSGGIQIMRLNRKTAMWEAALFEQRPSSLLGYDGETLVVTAWPGNDEQWMLRRYVRSTDPAIAK